MEGNKEGKISMRHILVLFAGLFLVYNFLSPIPPQHHHQPPLLPSSPLPPTILLIEKIGVQAPVIFSHSTKEADIQNYLRHGVVHLPQSALPGEIGNCYIVGHSSDYLTSLGDYKKVFERLPELQAGDLIAIQSGAKTISYKVRETRIVAPSDLSVLSQETAGERLLTLQTSYPIGTAQKRFLTVAVEVEK